MTIFPEWSTPKPKELMTEQIQYDYIVSEFMPVHG